MIVYRLSAIIKLTILLNSVQRKLFSQEMEKKNEYDKKLYLESN